MQIGSSETLIGRKSGKTTYVPLWDRMEGACGYGQSDGAPLSRNYFRGFSNKFKMALIELSGDEGKILHETDNLKSKIPWHESADHSILLYHAEDQKTG